ncbi:MAG: hypothetical protein KKH68_13865, partial [Proteobacteria bacterium]|nr:hypothetical protein [Pseudomonadota bacterium]
MIRIVVVSRKHLFHGFEIRQFGPDFAKNKTGEDIHGNKREGIPYGFPYDRQAARQQKRNIRKTG